MKKIFILLALIAVSQFHAIAQKSLILSQSDADMSAFNSVFKDQTWQLVGVAHNDTYTGLFFRVTVMNSSDGDIKFPYEAHISGSFGSRYPVAVRFNDKEKKLMDFWYYPRHCKGEYVDIILYFPRIPAGVKYIDYVQQSHSRYVSGAISWSNIPTGDNPDPTEKTNWTEVALRAHWDQNGCLPIEGIYYFTNTDSDEWWGDRKHTLAVIKDGYQYEIIYLRGSNPNVWKEGDLKASFVPTATRGLYKATAWFLEDKINNEDFYLQFAEGKMSIFENTNNVTADFLKLYPAVDENVEFQEANQNTQKGQRTSNRSEAKVSASGVFVSDKVLVTNNHVVSGADKVEVIVKDGNNVSTYIAKVLSTDVTNDLALLTIDDEKFTGIGKIPFALSSRTRDVGTSIFTMGYPLTSYMGEEVKITDGIINSKTGFDGDIVTYQISAPIQPGCSGAPLFDKAGYLIGITNAGVANAQNVGYAIKGSYLCNLIESAPIHIGVPETNSIGGLDFIEQVKRLSKYVVFIKVY